ncbi:hypothetical protein C9J85_08050 [Haloferax sp. wsp5]|nr:hypothetical protein C9J85_08050 [Haloferax sp. wsp5]
MNASAVIRLSRAILVLRPLAAGYITFSRAAEMAGLSVWDFAQLAKEREPPGATGLAYSFRREQPSANATRFTRSRRRNHQNALVEQVGTDVC